MAQARQNYDAAVSQRSVHFRDVMLPARTALRDAQSRFTTAKTERSQAIAARDQARSDYENDPSAENQAALDAANADLTAARAELAQAREAMTQPRTDRDAARLRLTELTQDLQNARATLVAADEDLTTCQNTPPPNPATATNIRMANYGWWSPETVVGDLQIAGLAPHTTYYLSPENWCGPLNPNCSEPFLTDSEGNLGTRSHSSYGMYGWAIALCENGAPTRTGQHVYDDNRAFVGSYSVEVPADICVGP